MNNLPTVSIIIVNYNGKSLFDAHGDKPLLEKCLLSVISIDYPKDKIFPILIDNNSTDGSVDFVKSKFPSIEIIINTENNGFAASNNLALKKVQTEYILLLNNDTEIERNALREMVNAASRKNDMGMLAPKILYKSRQNVIQSSGLLLRKSGRIFLCNNGKSANTSDNDPEEIFCPTGAAALYKKKLFDDVGFFEDDFYAYYEDVDLAWRAHHHGWKAEYVPTAVVYHDPSSSWKHRSQKQRYFCLRNGIFTIIRNWPAGLILLWFPYIALFTAIQPILFSLRYGDMISFIALLDTIKGVGKQSKKRKIIKNLFYFKKYFVSVTAELKTLISMNYKNRDKSK